MTDDVKRPKDLTMPEGAFVSSLIGLIGQCESMRRTIDLRQMLLMTEYQLKLPPPPNLSDELNELRREDLEAQMRLLLALERLLDGQKTWKKCNTAFSERVALEHPDVVKRNPPQDFEVSG